MNRIGLMQNSREREQLIIQTSCFSRSSLGLTLPIVLTIPLGASNKLNFSEKLECIKLYISPGTAM